MTKRDLVKWLEKEKEFALNLAKERRKQAIEQATNSAYEAIELDDFIDELSASFSQIIDNFDRLFRRCADHKGMSCHKFHWKLSYAEFKRYLDDPDHLNEHVRELISINTDEYNQVKREATLYCNNVELSYDDVIQTVKNLPTAKDGIEYLKKLGFNVSKIEPLKQEKQLPATISVNVDTKYLILDKK